MRIDRPSPPVRDDRMQGQRSNHRPRHVRLRVVVRDDDAKVVSHGRYITLQMAEVAVLRDLFRKILQLINDLWPRAKDTTSGVSKPTENCQSSAEPCTSSCGGGGPIVRLLKPLRRPNSIIKQRCLPLLFQQRSGHCLANEIIGSRYVN